MKKSIIMFLLAAALMAGCKSNEIMDYALTDRVYIHEVNVVSTVEQNYWEKNFSFAVQNSSLMDTIVPITVKLMGNIVDYDRIFRAKVLPEQSTAIEGVHYKLHDGIMKAGEYMSYIPVEVFRTTDTQEEAVYIAIELIDTQDLHRGNPGYLNFTLAWGDVLLQPTNWPYFWGTYYANKYRFAIDQLGQHDWPTYTRFDTDYIEGYFTTSELEVMAVQLNAIYAEYRLTNGPIYNVGDSGDEIYFGL